MKNSTINFDNNLHKPAQASGKGSQSAVSIQVIFLTDIPAVQTYPLMHLICQLVPAKGPTGPTGPFTYVCLLMVRIGTGSLQNVANI